MTLDFHPRNFVSQLKTEEEAEEEEEEKEEYDTLHVWGSKEDRQHSGFLFSKLKPLSAVPSPCEATALPLCRWRKGETTRTYF